MSFDKICLVQTVTIDCIPFYAILNTSYTMSTQNASTIVSCGMKIT